MGLGIEWAQNRVAAGEGDAFRPSGGMGRNFRPEGERGLHSVSLGATACFGKRDCQGCTGWSGCGDEGFPQLQLARLMNLTVYFPLFAEKIHLEPMHFHFYVTEYNFVSYGTSVLFFLTLNFPWLCI